MARNYKKIDDGLRIKAKATLTSDTNGELETSSSTHKTYLHNGTSSSPLVTEAHTATLTNKTLTSPVINTPTGITKTDVGLSNVQNLDQTNPTNITQDATHRFTNDTAVTRLANTSGTNTGDQTNITGNAATVTTNANLTGPITSVGNTTSVASQTGTGSKFVMDISPILITPNLGTPSTLVGTNISGTAASLTSGITNALASATTTVNVSSATAPSTGQVLTATDSTHATWAAPASSPSSFLKIDNLSFVTSVASNALTITIKDAAGNTPSSSTTAIAFRSATNTSGAFVTRTITSALSMTISSGSTLGHANATAKNIWLYAIDNAGTVELAVSSNQFDESFLYSTTAEGGAGGADSESALYSTTARTGVAIRLIGRMLSSQTTAGTWAAVPTDVAMTYQKEVSVSALYTGAPPTGTLSAGFNLVTFGTKVKDSHNAYSSGIYTVPVSGTYSISAMTSVSGTRALNTYDQIVIQIDGTTNIAGPFNFSGGAVSGVVMQASILSYPLLAGQTVRINSYTTATGPSWDAVASRNYFSIVKTGNY